MNTLEQRLQMLTQAIEAIRKSLPAKVTMVRIEVDWKNMGEIPGEIVLPTCTVEYDLL